jgi:hypothetical protein
MPADRRPNQPRQQCFADLRRSSRPGRDRRLPLMISGYPHCVRGSGRRSTLGDIRTPAAGPRPVRWRRVLVGLLVMIVGAGAAGLLGVHSTTSAGSGGGYEVTVEYASVARAGLDVPWQVHVRRAGGFDGPVTLAVTADYFGIYEEQGLDPQPTAESSDGTYLYWTFDPPPVGDQLTVDFDAYIQPSSQLGSSGDVSVLVGTERVATTQFHTWLVP